MVALQPVHLQYLLQYDEPAPSDLAGFLARLHQVDLSLEQLDVDLLQLLLEPGVPVADDVAELEEEVESPELLALGVGLQQLLGLLLDEPALPTGLDKQLQVLQPKVLIVGVLLQGLGYDGNLPLQQGTPLLH